MNEARGKDLPDKRSDEKETLQDEAITEEEDDPDKRRGKLRLDRQRL